MPTIELDYRVSAAGNARTLLLGAMAGGLAILLSPGASAQNAGALVDLDGNDAQKDAARLVDDTCPELVPGFINGDLSPDGQQLVTVCSNMIVDQLRASGANPDLLDALVAEGFDGYGLDAEGLNNALQALHGEEIQAAQSRVGEIRAGQEQGIFSRLAAIRTGSQGGGISVTNLNFEAGDQLFKTSDLASVDQDKYEILPAAWLEDETWSKLGFFVTGGVTFGDKDDTGQSDGFDFNSLNLTFGGDYRVTDSFVVGAALGYNRFASDVDTTERSPEGEDLGSDGYLVSIFASYNWDSGLFIDGVASYGEDDYDSTRRIVIDSQNPGEESINETAGGNFDSKHYGVAANLGYQFETHGFTVTPVARVEYV
ncbi:MAG: autotransporter outer membrane beta-barrel domain-containing protein, partial [Geminicoccaceae bacterium]